MYQAANGAHYLHHVCTCTQARCIEGEVGVACIELQGFRKHHAAHRINDAHGGSGSLIIHDMHGSIAINNIRRYAHQLQAAAVHGYGHYIAVGGLAIDVFGGEVVIVLPLAGILSV